MADILDTINYDEVDFLPIEVSRGDVIQIEFEAEEGETLADDNFRVVIGKGYSSRISEEYTIGSGITKTEEKYVLTFDTVGAFDNSSKLVYDVFGLPNYPKRRIGKGSIQINESFV